MSFVLGKLTLGRPNRIQQRCEEAKMISARTRQQAYRTRYARCIRANVHMADEHATPAIPLRGSWTAESEFVAPAAPDAISWRRLILKYAIAMVAHYVLTTVIRIYMRNYYIFFHDYLHKPFTPAPVVH